jgi:hypothetical protein
MLPILGGLGEGVYGARLKASTLADLDAGNYQVFIDSGASLCHLVG